MNNKNSFDIEIGKGYTYNFSVSVSRQTASWKDKEKKPLEWTTFIGLFIDDHGFTGISIYDWDGDKEEDIQWVFKGSDVTLGAWIRLVQDWLGDLGMLELAEDITANKHAEQGFTQYYQVNSPR